MKLVIAVVQGSDADDVLEALTTGGYRATQINSAGGFLRVSNVTFLIGVDDDQVQNIATIIGRHSNARRTFVNPLMPFAAVDVAGADFEPVRVGASIFVLPVRRFVRLTE